MKTTLNNRENDEPFERSINKCSRLLMVRIQHFQCCDTGSNPVGSTSEKFISPLNYGKLIQVRPNQYLLSPQQEQGEHSFALLLLAEFSQP